MAKTIGSEVRPSEAGYEARERSRGGDDSWWRRFTDWTVRPLFNIRVEGENPSTIFQVELHTDRERSARAADGEVNSEQMPSRLFDTVANMRSWCHDRNLSWEGSQRDLEGLRQLISSAEVPWLTGVEVIGLHGTNTFVLPGEVIGEAEKYVYVAPQAGSEHWARAINLQPSDFGAWFYWQNGDALKLLADLHSPGIMTPILGWMAVAPLRSLCAEFPVLAVLGGAGYGKTTLIRSVLQALGFRMTEPMNLTSSTEYGISSYCASTNALPVWIDEWRANTGRDDARRTFAQIIRDSWNGASSIKGGGGPNRMKLIKTTARAPLVFSGEGQLSERSHLERCVIVQVGPGGRNKEALTALHATDEVGLPLHPTGGLGRDYIEFLRESVLGNELRPPSHSSTSGSRSKHSLAVVEWGYDILRFFADEHGIELPRFDGSKVEADTKAAQQDSILLSLLVVVHNDKAAVGIVEPASDGLTYVSVEALANYAARYVNDPDLVLAGGSRTIRQQLKDELGAEQCDGKKVGIRRAWRFPTPVELQ